MEADGKFGFVCFDRQCIQAVMVTAAGMASDMVGRFRVTAERLSFFLWCSHGLYVDTFLM